MIARRFWVALQFMTRLPTPRISNWRDDEMARAAPLVALTGAVVGAVVGCVFVGMLTLAPPIVAALAGLLAWIWVTGALHLDGLGDTADGLAATHAASGATRRRDPTRFLEIARSPTAGPFAIVAVSFVLVAKAALLVACPPPGASALQTVFAITLVGYWARWIALLAAHALPSLGDGRGSSVRSGLSWSSLLGQAAVAGVISLVLAPAIAIAAPLLAVVAWAYWRRALGGMNGDTLGATIEACEVALLAVFLAAPHAPIAAWIFG
ncbi:MAG: adenosylcobinamide-GDP ribazoletransferase [Pseudomonadota bacterium]